MAPRLSGSARRSGSLRGLGSEIEFDGSPLIAINQKEPFSEIVLLEGEPDHAAALRQRIGQAAAVIQGDCNHPQVIQELRSRLGDDTLGLAFVDNLGLDVYFARRGRG